MVIFKQVFLNRGIISKYKNPLEILYYIHIYVVLQNRCKKLSRFTKKL
jgi:hypothetical protein